MSPLRKTGKRMTVAGFLAALPAERRREIEAVREVVRRRVPPGYEEAVAGTMLVWQVPLAVYPDTYNGRALWYVAMGSQKNYLTLYLMATYADRPLERRLKEGFAAAGKMLDIGKACIRFKRADDLALDVVGEIVASLPLERWVAIAKAARRR